MVHRTEPIRLRGFKNLSSGKRYRDSRHEMVKYPVGTYACENPSESEDAGAFDSGQGSVGLRYQKLCGSKKNVISAVVIRLNSCAHGLPGRHPLHA